MAKSALIAGLQSPDQGLITFGGQNSVVAQSGPTCAMVFQDQGLFPWLTVLENAAFGLEMQGVDRRRTNNLDGVPMAYLKEARCPGTAEQVIQKNEDTRQRRFVLPEVHCAPAAAVIAQVVGAALVADA